MNPPVAQQYDVTVAIANPKTYAETAGTTAYASICGTAGAANIAFVADGTGNGPANDEGLSAAIATPAGFTFYGVPAAALRVSTNGWLTLAGIPTDAAFSNIAMPDREPRRTAWSRRTGMTSRTSPRVARPSGRS